MASAGIEPEMEDTSKYKSAGGWFYTSKTTK
jgi:hypothetical protein